MTIHSSGSIWKPFVRSGAVEVDTKFPRDAWTSTYPGHGEIYPATSERSNVGQYAVDFMILSKAQGDAIAAYVWANRKRLGVRYVIWYRRIISETNLPSTWRPYTNPVASRRGTASGDHTNHVHASFFSNGTHVPLTPTRPTVWDGHSFPGADAFYLGAHGDYVTLLGQRLVAHGWTGYQAGPGPDFSEADRAAVEWFQRKQGWTGADADGIPGEQTWQLLMADPKPAPTPIPKPEEPAVATKIRVASFNVLKSTKADPFADRRNQVAKVLRASQASIYLLQECDAADVAKLQDVLGADWIWSRGGANTILVDKTVWTMGTEKTYHLPTPYSSSSTKTCPLVELTHISSGKVVWATSVHPTATLGRDQTKMSEERRQQAIYIDRQVKSYSRLIGGGDFNSSSMTVGKPKQVLKAAGYKLLTLDADFQSKNVDSFDNKTPGGQQIDDIFVRGLEITDGKIISGDAGSDHNLLWAELTL